jgi:diguanylate cyclase (GGDEF)-like protein
MSFSKKLLAPMVSSAVALIAVTNYCIVKIVAHPGASTAELLSAIWPIALPTSITVILVMSILYQTLLDAGEVLENNQRDALHCAQHDALTGIASRPLLEERLEQAIRRHSRTGEPFAVIMLDLDHFKRVNDLLGHQIGDEVLKEAARRLQSLVRDTDTVARFGGDEFLVLQTGLAKPTDVRRLCSRICKEMQVPYGVAGREMTLPVSVGAVAANKRVTTSCDYIRAADMALYDAKDSGRNCYRFFSDKLDDRLKRRDFLETDLRKALQSGDGLAVHFQPQINGIGKIIGVESLFRWSHPTLGQIRAAEAVDVAEESGLISVLGEYVFRQAARFARVHPELSVAINLSPAQFARTGELANVLRQMAREEGVNPTQIELEITEQLFMHKGLGCDEQMRRLRAYGFRLALDDFGTGYSSLSYLRRFQVDRLKLDKSFASSEDIQENIAFVRAAVTLAHLFGLEVVAEGIETELQEAVALEAGCDALQGYRYAAAMEEGEFDIYAGTKLRSAA